MSIAGIAASTFVFSFEDEESYIQYKYFRQQCLLRTLLPKYLLVLMMMRLIYMCIASIVVKTFVFSFEDEESYLQYK